MVTDIVTKSFHNLKLQRNKMIHAGEKAYACRHCDKKFSQSQIAKRYKMIHAGKNHMLADIVSKSFHTLKSHVAKHHEWTHTGEKSCAYRYCDKKFSQSQIAKRYEKIHTGEKPYACRYCDKKFSQSKI